MLTFHQFIFSLRLCFIISFQKYLAWEWLQVAKSLKHVSFLCRKRNDWDSESGMETSHKINADRLRMYSMATKFQKTCLVLKLKNLIPLGSRNHLFREYWPLERKCLAAGAKKLSSIWQKIKHFEMLQHFSFAETSTPHIYHRPGWRLDKNARSFFVCCDFLWTLFLESGVVLSPLQKLPLLSKAINLQNMTTLMLKKK